MGDSVGEQDTGTLVLWRRRVKRWLSWPFVLVIALLIWFEELAWDELAALIGFFSRLRWVAWLEHKIRQLPPWLAVSIFLLPAMALLPVKLLALLFIEQGHVVFGVSVILAAKLLGTAVVAWLFKLTEPVLMQVSWFANGYRWFMAWKHRLYERIQSTAEWQWIQSFRAAIKARWRSRGLLVRLGKRLAQQWARWK